MPANWLYMDAKFPDFDGDISTEDKLAQVQNYLYLLVEQMRYTMQNLDTTNLNQTALNVWEEAITKPLYLLLEGEGERLTQLSVTADGLTALVQSQQQQVQEVKDAQVGTQETVDGLEESLAQVSSRVELALTSDQVEIAIEKKLAQGVDSVTTKTGFTFDDEGLIAGKPQTGFYYPKQLDIWKKHFLLHLIFLRAAVSHSQPLQSVEKVQQKLGFFICMR